MVIAAMIRMLAVAALSIAVLTEAASAVAADFWQAAGFRCQLTHGSYGQWEFWDYPGTTLDPKVSHDVTELVVTGINPETETATVVGNVGVTTVKVHGFEHAVSFFEPGAEGTAGLTIWDTPIETADGYRYPVTFSFHYTSSPADGTTFPIPHQLYGLCGALPKQAQQ